MLPRGRFLTAQPPFAAVQARRGRGSRKLKHSLRCDTSGERGTPTFALLAKRAHTELMLVQWLTVVRNSVAGGWLTSPRHQKHGIAQAPALLRGWGSVEVARGACAVWQQLVAVCQAVWGGS